MMRHRAASSGLRLTEADAAIIKGMLARGDRQHDIAAWFGVNAGRIAEIATGASFHWVPARINDLPPPGPYAPGKQIAEAMRAVDHALDALADAESQLRSLVR